MVNLLVTSLQPGRRSSRASMKIYRCLLSTGSTRWVWLHRSHFFHSSTSGTLSLNSPAVLKAVWLPPRNNHSLAVPRCTMLRKSRVAFAGPLALGTPTNIQWARITILFVPGSDISIPQAGVMAALTPPDSKTACERGQVMERAGYHLCHPPAL